jgi:hypothetical protein
MGTPLLLELCWKGLGFEGSGFVSVGCCSCEICYFSLVCCFDYCFLLSYVTNGTYYFSSFWHYCTLIYYSYTFVYFSYVSSAKSVSSLSYLPYFSLLFPFCSFPFSISRSCLSTSLYLSTFTLVFTNSSICSFSFCRQCYISLAFST